VIDVTDKQSAWEQSGKFEGDIMLTDVRLRTGWLNTDRRWPNAEVPFVINSVFNTAERQRILMAIDEFHNKTLITFRQYNPWTDRDFIYITGQNDGCRSFVGRIGGRQQLNLERNDCLLHGNILHQLMHALGFFHMHTATDRDNYVTINWDNIEPGRKIFFFIQSATLTTSFGVPYDYDSIMHWGPYAFSGNGNRTIEPKDPNAQIGQRDGLSEKDIERIARMYGTTYETSTSQETSTSGDYSYYATPSLFITLIIINLNICTHLQ